MVKVIINILLLSFILHQNITRAWHGLTFAQHGGRFGDQILYYIKGEMLADKYGLDLYLCTRHNRGRELYQLALARHHPHYNRRIRRQFERVISIQNESQINVNSNVRTLHIINFYIKAENVFDYIDTHPLFLQKLKKMINPRVSIPSLNLPEDKITVAVHVRKGIGHDPPLASQQQYADHHNLVTYNTYHKYISDQKYPFKFPPDQYYIDQIIKLSELLDDQPLYVYLFTDHPRPETLIATYKKAINKPNIIFDCRKNNNYARHVLYDFFGMIQFDCFIRGGSNFSIGAQLIGNHRMVIYPQRAQWIGKKLVIDQVGIIIRDQELHKTRFLTSNAHYVCETKIEMENNVIVA